MVAMKEEEAIYKNKQTKNPRSISKKKKNKIVATYIRGTIL
jgi:hypothetical protein